MDADCAIDRLKRRVLKRRKQMKNSTTDKLEGAVHEAKGKIKETVGRLGNDPDLEAEGQDENLTGKIQKKVGQVKEVFEK
jgi:uncharacterized protein YjbJ (UPF0337 family)